MGAWGLGFRVYDVVKGGDRASGATGHGGSRQRPGLPQLILVLIPPKKIVIRGQGLRVKGFRFRVWGLGFRVQGSGFRV